MALKDTSEKSLPEAQCHPENQSPPDSFTFRPYESRRDEAAVVHDMNVEASPNWLLKNSLSDCVYQNDENSLRRNMTEIKTYEVVYTGSGMAAKFGGRTTSCPSS